MFTDRRVSPKFAALCTRCTRPATVCPRSFIPFLIWLQIINRPGVAGAVLQSPSLLIDWRSEWPFTSKPSNPDYTETVRARKTTFWETVHPQRHVTCQVSSLLYPVEPFNEVSTLSLSTLAVPQILYSTEPVLASGLDWEGGTDVQGRLWQLSILYLESEISLKSGKEACIHSTPRSRILLRKVFRSYEKVRI